MGPGGRIPGRRRPDGIAICRFRWQDLIFAHIIPISSSWIVSRHLTRQLSIDIRRDIYSRQQHQYILLCLYCRQSLNRVQNLLRRHAFFLVCINFYKRHLLSLVQGSLYQFFIKVDVEKANQHTADKTKTLLDRKPPSKKKDDALVHFKHILPWLGRHKSGIGISLPGLRRSS